MKKNLQQLVIMLLIVGCILMGFAMGHRWAKRDMEAKNARNQQPMIWYDISVDSVDAGYPIIDTAAGNFAGVTFEPCQTNDKYHAVQGQGYLIRNNIKVVPKKIFLCNYPGRDHVDSGKAVLREEYIGGNNYINIYDDTALITYGGTWELAGSDSLIEKRYTTHSEGTYSTTIIPPYWAALYATTNKDVVYRDHIIPDDGIQHPDRWQMDSLGRLYYYGHLWNDTTAQMHDDNEWFPLRVHYDYDTTLPKSAKPIWKKGYKINKHPSIKLEPVAEGLSRASVGGQVKYDTTRTTFKTKTGTKVTTVKGYGVYESYANLYKWNYKKKIWEPVWVKDTKPMNYLSATKKPLPKTAKIIK